MSYVSVNGKKIKSFGLLDHAKTILLRYAVGEGINVKHLRVVQEITEGTGINEMLKELVVARLQDEEIEKTASTNEILRRLMFLYPIAPVEDIRNLIEERVPKVTSKKKRGPRKKKVVIVDDTELQKQKLKNDTVIETFTATLPLAIDPTLTVTKFAVQKQDSVFELQGAQDKSLRQLFDEAQLSPTVPFIAFKDLVGGRTPTVGRAQASSISLFKAHTDGPIIEEKWVSDTEYGLTVVTTLNSIVSTIKLESPNKATVITTGDGRNVLEYVLSVLFQGRISVTFSSPLSSSVEIHVTPLVWSRIIMGELIRNDDLVSKLLFINEKTETFLKRNGSTIFYDPGHTYDLDDVNYHVLKFTTHRIKGGLQYQIKNILSSQEASAFANAFLRVLRIYELRREEILDLYEETAGDYIAYEKKILSKTKVEDVEEAEIGRLAALQRYNKKMFHGKYAARCQAPRQPILIEKGKKLTSREITKIVKDRYGGDFHRVLEYPKDGGVWYACMNSLADAGKPVSVRAKRAKSKKPPAVHEWPGLNVPNENNPEFTPCCFKEDQYEKKTNALKRYLASVNRAARAANSKKSSSAYVLKSNKFITAGQFATPPGVVKRILELNKDELKTITQKQTKTEFWSIVRAGVEISTHSILDCLEKATKSNATDVRKKISDMLTPEIVASGAQELNETTLEDLKRELSDNSIMIDPRKWFSILEAVYNCSLFLFFFTKQNEGEFVIPKSQMPYLFRKKTPGSACFVVLMRPQPSLPAYTWNTAFRVGDAKHEDHSGIQCEILTDISRETSKFDFSGTKFEKTLFHLREDIVTRYSLAGTNFQVTK